MYVSFYQGCYQLFKEEKIEPLFSDSSHEFLFGYVAKDLSRLQALLTEYLNKRMDPTDLTLLDFEEDEDEIAEIEKEVKTFHPYCEHNYAAIVVDYIGNYLNFCICYSDNRKKVKTDGKYDVDKYLKYFKHLCPSAHGKRGTPYQWLTADKYFSWLISWDEQPITDYIGDDMETFIVDLDYKIPVLYTDLRAKEALQNILSNILDIDTPVLNELSIPQRAWLYNRIFYQSNNSLPRAISKHMIPSNIPRDSYLETKYDSSDVVLLLQKRMDINKTDNSTSCADEEKVKQIVSLFEEAKKIDLANVAVEYDIEDLQQLLYLEVLDMIENNVTIRKCARCGKYFVVTNRKAIYCDRIDEQGKKCSDVGPAERYQKKKEQDEALTIYERAYKTHYARIKKGKMTKAQFFDWTQEAKEKLEQTRNGELDIPTYQAWLKK